MPGPKAPSGPRSADERPALLTRIRAHTTPQPCSCRAHILLPWAEGPKARAVARPGGTSRVPVRRWRSVAKMPPAQGLPPPAPASRGASAWP